MTVKKSTYHPSLRKSDRSEPIQPIYADGTRNFKLTSPRISMSQNAFTFNTVQSVPPLVYPTLYASPLITLTKHGYTKHYFEGMNRICSKLGGGFDAGLLGEIEDTVPALACNYVQQSKRQNEGVNRTFADCLGMGAEVDGKYDLYKVVVRETERDEKEPAFYYHSDHLGSASWITDKDGNPVQHLQYLPYGEPYINQRTTGYNERFTFTGKERDEETGFGYFGARYMDHELMTMWLSVDPMADKYPSISPYAYCAWNPVRLVDPDGREIHIVGDEQYRAQVYSLLNKLAKSGLAGKYLVYHALKDKKRIFTFIQPSEKNNHENNTLYVNGQNGEKTAVLFDANESGSFSADNGGVEKNALTSMAHELAHFVFPQDGRLLTEKGEGSNIPAGEPIAVQWENRVRKDLGMDMRKKYAGRNVYNKGISESSKYSGWYNLTNVSGYLNPPTDVGSFNIKNRGDVKPYFYKGGGRRINIEGSWKEARYTL